MNMMSQATSGNDALQFLKQIFHGADAGTVVLWLKVSKTDSETYTFPVTDLEGAAAHLAELALRGDTYVGRGLQGVPLSPGERGKEPGVVFVGGLFADIDTREGPHTTPAAELPADADEAMQLITEAKLPPPTLLIGTGGGCHAHWLYSSPAMILTPEERAAEKMLSKAIQKRLRDTFKTHGYVLDGTADLTRVCKASGTLNHKTSPNVKPVRLIHQGERYDRAELAELLASDLSMAARGVPGAGKGSVAEMIRAEATKAHLASGKAKPDEFAPVLAGCAFIQHCDTAVEKVSEPWWYKMVGVVARTVNGRRWVHEMSKRHPGYTFEETETKIDQALAATTGPTLCSTVAEGDSNSPPFEGCARCPFRASIRTPLALANQGRAMTAIQQGVVFVTKGRTYLHLAGGDLLNPEEFGDSIAAKVGKNPHSQMMLSPTMPKVMHRDYRAGDPNLILQQEDGSKAVNLWQRGGVVPAAGDYQPILDYFKRFIPDTRSRDHVIQYLAHLVQHPGVKIEHGIVVTGGYGTGKGTLRDIMYDMFGVKNVQKVEGEELSDKNNSKWVNCQVLVFEETSQGEKFEVYNRTKELVTGETFRVQDKYIARYEGRTPRGIFMASNDVAPITIMRNDRRWFVCDTPESPETEDELAANHAFFANVREILNRDTSTVAAFMHYLLTEVSLKGFTVKGAPPMTAAKKRAMEDSRTPAAGVLADLIAVGAHPFDRDVVSASQVLEAIKLSGWAQTVERMNMKKVADAIRSVGGFPVNVIDGEHLQVRVSRQLAPRLWGIRNKAKLVNATTDELRTEWLGGKPASEAEVVQLRDRGLARIMAS
ncbi:DUF5906 domain-containing protein [Methylobacterium ajmalii]|uniref:DUF5906 domain-containing protein n=1 Tax=Methylobacterium ajmalii TaxID=2738439 RepID=A0ABV0A564_9HYPH